MRAQQPSSPSREDPEERSYSDGDDSASSASEVTFGQRDDLQTSEHSRGGPLAAYQVHRLSDLVEVDEESDATTGFIQTAAASKSATGDEPKMIEMTHKPGIQSIFALDPSYYQETADGTDLPPWLPPPSGSGSSMSVWASQTSNNAASQGSARGFHDDEDKYLARVVGGFRVFHPPSKAVEPLQVSLGGGDIDDSQDVCDDDDSEEFRIEPWPAPVGYKDPPRLMEQTSASYVPGELEGLSGSYDETEEENGASTAYGYISTQASGDTQDHTRGRLNTGYVSAGHMQGYSPSTPVSLRMAIHLTIDYQSPTLICLSIWRKSR
jgi:hypothetical protein